MSDLGRKRTLLSPPLPASRRASPVQCGQLIEANELANRLGITFNVVSEAQEVTRLFDLERGDGKWLYPASYAAPWNDGDIAKP